MAEEVAMAVAQIALTPKGAILLACAPVVGAKEGGRMAEEVAILCRINVDGSVEVCVREWSKDVVPDGEREFYVTDAEMVDNFAWEYAELRAAVEGPLEGYHRFPPNDPSRRLSAYCHENGKLEQLPLNKVATWLWARWLGCALTEMSDHIVGPVIVTAGPFDAGTFDAQVWVAGLGEPG